MTHYSSLITGILALALLLDCAAPPQGPTGTTTPFAASPLALAPTATPGPPPAELSAAATPTPEGPIFAPLQPLTADTAMDQVVERAPLPPEARLLARTLRPTMTAEQDSAGHWIVTAGTLGQWRVNETTWQVEPFDGTAELWELQSRLDLR